MTAVPAIALRSLVKRFGDVTAVDEVDLDVEQGEFFSLLGPSGCGKTTTLRMMAGFEFPDAGTVALDGRDVTWVPANKRAVNLVFQRYELFPHMTVAENVGYGLRLKRVPRTEIRERVQRMLEIVGVGGLQDRRADQLSGGQQQRVALARALVNRPRVLLLDEPLSALDVKLRKRMQLELKSIQAELGTTFVYVTHDQEEALLLSDRVGIMSDGRLLQVGTPREVYERPAHSFVADFVGTLNDLHLDVGEVTGATSVARPDGDDVVVLPAILAVGARVRAAVRPERIRLHPQLDDVPAAGTSLRGDVADVLYLGAVTQYIVATSVGLLTVQAPSDDRTRELLVGQKVAVTWPADALLVLPDDD